MNQDKKVKRFLVISTLLITVTFCALLWDEILNFLLNLMEEFNIRSRTLEMLVNGELTSLDSRSRIIGYSLTAIRNNGNKISGLFADRYYLQTAGQYTGWIAYPHNIFLEFLLDFGYIGGSILSIWLVLKLISNMLVGTKQRKTCTGIFASLVMLRLFVSSSFLIEGLFYTMLGLLGGVKRHAKQSQKQKSQK